MTTQADHESSKKYVREIMYAGSPAAVRNLAACYLDALRQIEALENDLAIADLAWKVERERSKKVEREIEALEASPLCKTCEPTATAQEANAPTDAQS